MDWSLFRAEFPSLDRMVYLNTAGGGPICRQAADAARAYYDEAESLADTQWDEWLARTEVVREQVAGLIGATPSQVSFLQNTSLAMNIISKMFEPGQKVVALDAEFPSCTLPWMNSGHFVRLVDTDGVGGLTPDQLRDTLTPDDDVLVVSSVQFATGYRADLSAFGQICKDAGVRFVVDATQSICAYDIDLNVDGIDALMFSGYKWAAAGYGIAVLCLAESMSEFDPPLVGWRSANHPYRLENSRLELGSGGAVHELGHPTFPGIFSLGGAISTFNRVGIPVISARIDSLCDRMRRELVDLGFEITSSTKPGATSGIVRVSSSDSDRTAKALQEHGVWISSRRGQLRMSVHAFNNDNDLDALVQVLGDVREAV